MKKTTIIFLLTGSLVLSIACNLGSSTTITPNPPTQTDSLEPEAPDTPAPPTAKAGTPFADKVISFTQGPIPPDSGRIIGSDPDNTLGPPDGVISPCCSGLVTLGTSGSLEVEFTDNVVTNGPGPDLAIIGDPQDDEKIQVSVSTDGETWVDLGLASENATFDLNAVGLEFARYVRIVDDGVAEAGGNNSAEVDALEALHNGPPLTRKSLST